MCLCVWTMSLIVRGSPSHLAEYIDAHTCYPHNLQSKEKKPKDCDKCEHIHKGLVTDKQEPIARCTHCEKWPWAQNEKETKRDEDFSGKRQLSNPDFCSNPRSEHKVDMFHLHFVLSFMINPVIWSDQSSSLPIYVMSSKAWMFRWKGPGYQIYLVLFWLVGSLLIRGLIDTLLPGHRLVGVSSSSSNGYGHLTPHEVIDTAQTKLKRNNWNQFALR